MSTTEDVDKNPVCSNQNSTDALPFANADLPDPHDLTQNPDTGQAPSDDPRDPHADDEDLHLDPILLVRYPCFGVVIDQLFNDKRPNLPDATDVYKLAARYTAHDILQFVRPATKRIVTGHDAQKMIERCITRLAQSRRVQRSVVLDEFHAARSANGILQSGLRESGFPVEMLGFPSGGLVLMEGISV